MSLHNRLKLIRKFLKGKATSFEERLINTWYYSIDDSVAPPIWQEDTKKESMKAVQRRALIERIQLLQERQAKVIIMRARAVRAVAVFIGVVAITGGIIFLTGRQRNPALQYSYIEVPLGKIKRLVLPDSSVVWLKSGTIFRYSNRYGITDRNVDIMDGEAWFDVRKDEQHPFLVNAGGLRTRVLGTAFNVQAFKDNPITQVWVDHGSVQVSDSGGVLGLLTNNLRLQRHKNNGYWSIDSLRWQQALAWQKGVLLLESTSFDELALQLKEVYGIIITTQDPSIRRQLYDAKFFIRTPVQDILQTLSEVHHIHLKSRNGHVIFY